MCEQKIEVTSEPEFDMTDPVTAMNEHEPLKKRVEELEAVNKKLRDALICITLPQHDHKSPADRLNMITGMAYKALEDK